MKRIKETIGKYKGFIIVAICAVLVDFFCTGQIKVNYYNDYCTIGSTINTIQIKYKEVEKVSWYEKDNFVPGVKIGGIDTFTYYSSRRKDGTDSSDCVLMMDKYYSGKILIVYTENEKFVIGSNYISMEDLEDTLQKNLKQ